MIVRHMCYYGNIDIKIDIKTPSLLPKDATLLTKWGPLALL